MRTNKKIILVFSILILIICSIFFIKNKRTKINVETLKTSVQNKDIPQRHVKIKYNFKKITEHKEAYHFDVLDSIMYVYNEKNILKYDLNSSSAKNIINVGYAYRAFKLNDTTLFFSDHTEIIQSDKDNSISTLEDKKLHYYLNNKHIKSEDKLVSSWQFAGINENYYFIDDTSSNKQDCVLKSSKNKIVLNISDIIDKRLAKVDTLCKKNYTEGELCNYTKDTLAYIFFKINAVLLINVNDGKYREIKTFAPYDLVPLKSNTVKIPNSDMTMMNCSPTSDFEYFTTSIAVNDKYVFMPSEFSALDENKQPCELIDVFEKFTFKYLYTIRFTMVDDQFIIDVRANENSLFLLTNTGNIYSTKLNL